MTQTKMTSAGAQTTISTQIRQFCERFDIRDPYVVHQLVDVLDSGAQSFVRDPKARLDAGSDLKIWTDLRRLWLDLARAHFPDSSNMDIDPQCLQPLCIALARFIRNIVAGVPLNQLNAFNYEPEIRRLLHYYTSWSAMKDGGSMNTACALAQALCNTVTSNEPLVDKLWELYLNLPEDEVVLIRLIGSHDPKMLLITLVFILNCTHHSTKRMQMMVKSNVGIRISVGLFDKMIALHEAEEGTEGAKAFDVGYAIVSEIIEMGLLPDLYRNFTTPNEIIVPHQTTLLKFLDSYLQSLPNIYKFQPHAILRIHESLGSFLAKRFFSLSEFAQTAIHKSLGMTPYKASRTGDRSASYDSMSSDSELEMGGSIDKTSALQQINLMLVQVCEGLVLVAQCMVTVCLGSEMQREGIENGDPTLENFVEMRSFFNRKKYQESGMVESLIDLLTLLDIFLPRINFGKPVHQEDMPQETTTEGINSSTGFSYLKRDLVRLLGVLCHGVKSVQDRVREAGGLPVVMNMCVIDERNPYLREHAIFTTRNLVKDNPENQKFVNSIKPAREWAADGTLKSRVKMSQVK